MLATALGALVFLALMAGLFVPLEWLFPASAHRPGLRAMGVGAALFLVDTLLMEAVGAPVLDALARSSGARTLATVGLVFVLSDLAGYWVHRAMHRVPWLWGFHALHHEAVELSWLDAWRQHPVDFVLHGVAVGVPGALLGVSLGELASVVVLRKAFTTFLHANVRAPFGPFFWVLASPGFHRTHHGADPADFNTNFAGTFPLWDLLFGTARRPPVVVEAPSVS
ncbi:MAG: sterol desaturase family protein [Myxococcaceae bacterium]|nr:sterol desaturase family protein [Myxococcaceae bacterium]